MSNPLIKLSKNDLIWPVSHPRTIPIVYQMSTLFLIRCGSGFFKDLGCILSLVLGTSDAATFLGSLLYFITAIDCRSRCVRFLLCKVLVVSLITDFLRKNLREETF